MNRIDACFAALRARGETGLIVYVTVGVPRRESTVPAVEALLAGGADIVELGVPFSDPLAEGTTIQRASFTALQNGVTPETCFEVAAELRHRGVDAPLLLMGYFNPILRMGPASFARRAAAAGVDGVIVPDLPPEEADELREALAAHDLRLVFLVAPTSDEARIARIAAAGQGFLYCVSVTGVTGAREELDAGLAGFLDRVRAATDLPLAVGFGISTPEHVRQVAGMADAAIVGSAIVDRMDALPEGELEAGLRDFAASLKGGVVPSA